MQSRTDLSNAQRLELARQFDASQKQQQAQFDANMGFQNKNLQSTLAQSLLAGATSLRGPESWLDYAQYTNGGKNIFERVAGGTPAPAFGAPTGYSAPMNMNSLLKSLGLGDFVNNTIGGSGSSTQMQPMSQATAPLTGGNVTQDFPQTGSGTTGGTTPLVTGLTGQQGNKPMGFGNQLSNGTSAFTGAETTPTTPQYQAPLPHQINPAVWDSMSDVAKKMILASAAKGNTQSGAWDEGDYLKQIDAARPQGRAPQRVSMNYSNPQSYF
jgi:hypothetical protein